MGILQVISLCLQSANKIQPRFMSRPKGKGNEGKGKSQNVEERTVSRRHRLVSPFFLFSFLHTFGLAVESSLIIKKIEKNKENH